jgi:hypothetical protein
MPDVRKIENPLIGQPEIYISETEFYGSNQGNEGNKDKIGGD